MKMRKLIGAVLAVSLATAAVPTGASAHYVKYVKAKPVGKHFGGGSAVPWIIIGCAAGVVFAALAANARDNRELTAEEAWSCGLGFLTSTPRGSNAPVRAKG